MILNHDILTNIGHNIFYKAVKYWIEKLQNDLPLLRLFHKQFILEGLSIILKLNYFHRNGIFIHQIKRNLNGN